MAKAIVLGLRENWKQFALLVIVNAFVGGMVGMERSILPQLASETFGIASKAAVLSFIVAFGTSKALANYFTGKLANRWGRKNLLVAGWFMALPVPLAIAWAPHWYWVIAANVLLGLSQGLTWSSTVVMKIDLVGPKQRGLAMGFNEFAGYLAVGVVAFATGYIASEYGVRPYPFYLGMGIAIAGLLLSLFAVRDTRQFVQAEMKQEATTQPALSFWEITLKHPNLSAITQAGLVNNLNDGMVWGLLPLLLLGRSFDAPTIGLLAGIYPAVWGLGQLFTGALADRFPKKPLLFWGMLAQGLAIGALLIFQGFEATAMLLILLGLGTALVYPTFLAAIADETATAQRAEAIGVFRLWRDLGYAIGALLSGLLADYFGLHAAIGAISALTCFAALVVQLRMSKALSQ